MILLHGSFRSSSRWSAINCRQIWQWKQSYHKKKLPVECIPLAILHADRKKCATIFVGRTLCSHATRSHKTIYQKRCVTSVTPGPLGLSESGGNAISLHVRPGHDDFSIGTNLIDTFVGYFFSLLCVSRQTGSAVWWGRGDWGVGKTWRSEWVKKCLNICFLMKERHRRKFEQIVYIFIFNVYWWHSLP